MYCKLSQLGDSQTTLLMPFSCFMKKSTMKSYLHADQSKCTYYPNYFVTIIKKNYVKVYTDSTSIL